jgi:hypothetical protein
VTRKLTEAQAWRKMAEWCVTHGDFLCNATAAWAGGSDWYTAPFAAPWDAMHDRVSDHADMGFYSTEKREWTQYRQCLGWPNDAKGTRVIFCLLMALECEEEARNG